MQLYRVIFYIYSMRVNQFNLKFKIPNYNNNSWKLGLTLDYYNNNKKIDPSMWLKLFPSLNKK